MKSPAVGTPSIPPFSLVAFESETGAGTVVVPAARTSVATTNFEPCPASFSFLMAECGTSGSIDRPVHVSTVVGGSVNPW